MLIGSQRDMRICGTASGLHEALPQIAKVPPELIVVDLSLRAGLGLDLVKSVPERFPQVLTVVDSAFEERPDAEEVLRAGAPGYVNQRECDKKLLEAIRTVQTGRRFVSEEILQRLVNQVLRGNIGAEPASWLSDGKFETNRLIGQGFTGGKSPRSCTSERTRLTPIAKNIGTNSEKMVTNSCGMRCGG